MVFSKKKIHYSIKLNIRNLIKIIINLIWNSRKFYKSKKIKLNISICENNRAANKKTNSDCKHKKSKNHSAWFLN